MDRRAFFTRGAGKVAHAVTKHAEEKARANSTRWIRPPFAIEELDFLLACTRCNKCIEACPHDVIFALSARLGVKVFNTPALDLRNKACHMCEDWPCVNACDDNALKMSPLEDDSEETAQQEMPRIATAYIDEGTCLPYSGPECGACRVCPVSGAMSWIMEKPQIVTEVCTGCGLCRQACIIEEKAIHLHSKYKS